MEKLGLMTNEEMTDACNFNVAAEANVDVMAWSWSVALKVVLAVAAVFL